MNTASARSTAATGYTETVGEFLTNVMKYMALGLVVTALSSYIALQFVPQVDGAPAMSPWFWAFFVAQLVLVFAISYFGLTSRINPLVSLAMFLVYAAVTGIWLAPLALVYTGSSLVATFAVTAATFGASALYGMVTKRDLTGYGNFFFMALVGLLVAMVVNIFLGSTLIDYALSAFGILLFIGLTAYDMQKLEAMYRSREAATSNGLAVYGALTLYLDFINLFLFFLRFMGVKTSD